MACASLVLDQGLDMGGILDLRPAVVAAGMAGEHLRAIEDAHLGGVGQHREQALHVGVRNGIVVEIKPHVGGLAGLHRYALHGRIGIVRQCQQFWRHCHVIGLVGGDLRP